MQIGELGGVDILVNCVGAFLSNDHRDDTDPEALVDLTRYNALSVAAAVNAAEKQLEASRVRNAILERIVDFGS